MERWLHCILNWRGKNHGRIKYFIVTVGLKSMTSPYDGINFKQIRVRIKLIVLFT